jgi:REP element-mobilizing transposase RayT
MEQKVRTAPGHQALRKGRVTESGRIYHVITSTHGRYPYFNSFAHGRCVVGEMRRFTEEGCVDSLAWVLMPDHLHWLFALAEKNSLPEVIRLLKGRSACSLNRILQRQGPVWQKSFYDHALRKDEDVRLVAQYVIANPLRRGLVEDVLDYPLWDMIWI